MTKTIEQSFIDWESNTFGFGYGTGEEPILTALKGFMDTIPADLALPNGYDYHKIEAAIGSASTWFLINILANHKVDMIDYGSSPRFAWLTYKGMRLKAFIDSKTVQELVDLCTEFDPEYINCYPDACNCGPNGYQKDRKCNNPFWD